ncbi:MAG: adaptor protein MecA [Oscillospiraceae bacterium]|nr:adaptor protein MecA [Oscillospiraceae bacterium]
MTVHRLSAQSVKVQLSADELKLFLTEPVLTGTASPRMMRLIALLLAKAEASTGIPFSALPVTVELLALPQGGLAVYFTAQRTPVPARGSAKAKTTRIAAQFGDRSALRSCCMQLHRRKKAILNSSLYRFDAAWILTLKLPRGTSAGLHRLLLEYGAPFRLSAINRARLSEYGTCVYEKDAVSAVCREPQPRSD